MGFWINAFLINWLVNIIVIEFLAIRKLRNVIKVDEARDSKYEAFRRTDTFWYSRLWLYPTCPFMIGKFVFTFIVIFICAAFSTMVNYGVKEGEPVTGLRRWLISSNFYFTARVVCWAVGTSWISHEYPKTCYKKYLGEDWVADYDKERTGTVVCNHSAFHDSMLHGMV
jgi:hypothetical protein